LCGHFVGPASYRREAALFGNAQGQPFPVRTPRGSGSATLEEGQILLPPIGKVEDPQSDRPLFLSLSVGEESDGLSLGGPLRHVFFARMVGQLDQAPVFQVHHPEVVTSGAVRGKDNAAVVRRACGFAVVE